jgi:urease subunit gamma/beta
MRLTQVELDRVLVFTVAEMARKRRARGLPLNYPEATALIADEMMEAARGGADYHSVRALGGSVLTPADVMPGVAALCRGLIVEPVFGDGPRVIVLGDPIPDPSAEDVPGARTLAEGSVTINAGREATALKVTNRSQHVVNISSHYHFYEVNPRMEFDRPAAYGKHLDIQAGRSVIWKPGEEKLVDLVPYAGRRVVDGFQLTPPPPDQQ